MSRFGKFMDENRRWVAGGVLMLIIFSVLVYFVVTIPGDNTDLSVDEVFFNSIEMDGPDSDLKITVFLTNEGEDEIDDVMVRAFVIERDSNLARDEDRVDMGTISGKSTKEGDLFISIPNNDTYRIEILVFEDSKLTLRGSGTIDLVGVGVASDYTGSDDDDDNDYSQGSAPLDWGVDDEDGGALLGMLCVLMFPIAFVILIVILVVKNQKKKSGAVSNETVGLKVPDKKEGQKAIPLQVHNEKKKEIEFDIEMIQEEDYD